MLSSRLATVTFSRRLAHTLSTPRHDPFPDVKRYPAEFRATPKFAGSPKGHAEPYLADASKGGLVQEGALPGFSPSNSLVYVIYCLFSGMHSNTTANFMKNAFHHKELYPLFACFVFWGALFGYTVYWSFSKPDIWLDRSKTLPPWDWEREREVYYKRNTLWADPYGRSHMRIPELETLQDEMLEAAKAQGTR